LQTTHVTERLTEALAPEAEAHGLELVAVEQTGGRGMPVIRVLLDCEEGIGLDTVAGANEWVSAVVEAQDPFTHPYTLEVSSPGIDRPLTKPVDFERFAGQTATIKSGGVQNRHTWTGTLVGLDGDDVVLCVDGSDTRIALEAIQKARLKGVVDFSKGRGQQ
jgi:ribosome maturation factor RimP